MAVGDRSGPSISGGTAGVASSSVLAFNGKRYYLEITNAHATDGVWLNFGAAAVLNQGFYIPAGERRTWKVETGRDAWMVDAVYAIRAGSNDIPLGIAEVDLS